MARWLPRCLEKAHLGKFSVLLSVQLQYYGFLILYKMFEMRRNNMLLIYLTNKKDKVNRERKHGFDLRKWRKVRRSIELWWRKMLSDDVSEKFSKKSFRMGKDAFHELVIMLDPYISPKTTPNYRKLSTSKISNRVIILERYGIIMDDQKCFRGTSVYGF